MVAFAADSRKAGDAHCPIDSNRRQFSPIGAEISGLDLPRPLDAETARALIDAFHANQAIVIRDQHLEFEDFDRATREATDDLVAIHQIEPHWQSPHR